MTDYIDGRTAGWAIVTVLVTIAIFLAAVALNHRTADRTLAPEPQRSWAVPDDGGMR